MFDSLWPDGLQHTRPPCPSPTPRSYSISCPLSWWPHPTISSSITPFSSCPQSFPASGSFQRNQPFTSGGQSIGSFSFNTSPSNEHPGLILFKGNHKQDKNTTLRMGDNVCKRSSWRRINLQSGQAAQFSQFQCKWRTTHSGGTSLVFKPQKVLECVWVGVRCTPHSGAGTDGSKWCRLTGGYSRGSRPAAGLERSHWHVCLSWQGGFQSPPVNPRWKAPAEEADVFYAQAARGRLHDDWVAHLLNMLISQVTIDPVVKGPPCTWPLMHLAVRKLKNHLGSFIHFAISASWNGSCAQSLQTCLTLCDPMDCGPPGSSVCGILQARRMEWVVMPFSRGSS